jgi:hypothetical protein
MPRIAKHVRSNLIAYLALFVALGGTSYAALNLPAGSVGTKQLRNGAVTPPKIDGKLIGGTVRAWAHVSAAGREVAGSWIQDAHVIKGGTGVYGIELDDAHVRGCGATASVVADSHAANAYAPGSAVASVVVPANKRFPVGVAVQTNDTAGQAAPLPFLVEVLC